MATLEEYRDNLLRQAKSVDDKINIIAADVAKNAEDIEYNAEAIEELASIIGGDA